jgi:hypothetical protein
MQNLYGAFAPVDKWKEKLPEIWSTMVWREPKNHFDDCYFCIVNIIGINRNNCEKWSYPDLRSARRPVLHSDLVSVPPFCEPPQLSEDESRMSDIAQGKEIGGSGNDFQTTLHSERFDQIELSDLIRDLNLSKESSEFLVCRVKEKNVHTSSWNENYILSKERKGFSALLY